MDDPVDGFNSTLDRSLTQEEFEDLVAPDPAPPSVTYSTQDFDVSGLVQRLQRDSMLVPTFGTSDDRIATAGFQRGFVWNKTQMDRFIESLLLGYPVPGIFLVKQAVDNRLLVLDGQQRLVTLRRFYEGLHAGREFVLDNVGARFRGLTYKTLDDPTRFLLDDSFLQATIVSADGSEELNEAVYQIFERLNSGGTQLTPHEIRAALYAGPLIDFLEELNRDTNWRRLYGAKSARIRDQELILRIIALYSNANSYTRPLKTFLNRFVSDHRAVDDSVKVAGDLFARACELLNSVGRGALRRPGGSQVNVAQTEAIFVGLMHAIRRNSVVADLSQAIDTLTNEGDFIDATTRATADREAVSARVDAATQALTV